MNKGEEALIKGLDLSQPLIGIGNCKDFLKIGNYGARFHVPESELYEMPSNRVNAIVLFIEKNIDERVSDCYRVIGPNGILLLRYNGKERNFSKWYISTHYSNGKTQYYRLRKEVSSWRQLF